MKNRLTDHDKKDLFPITEENTFHRYNPVVKLRISNNDYHDRQLNLIQLSARDKRIQDCQSNIFYEPTKHYSPKAEAKTLIPKDLSHHHRMLYMSSSHLMPGYSNNFENVKAQYDNRKKVNENPNQDLKHQNQMFSDLFNRECGEKGNSPRNRQRSISPQLSWCQHDSVRNARDTSDFDQKKPQSPGQGKSCPMTDLMINKLSLGIEQLQGNTWKNSDSKQSGIQGNDEVEVKLQMINIVTDSQEQFLSPLRKDPSVRHKGMSASGFTRQKKLRKNTTMSYLNNPQETISRNYLQLLRSKIRKVIIVYGFIDVLHQYSSQVLQEKGEIKYHRREFYLPLYPDDKILLYWYQILRSITFISTILYPIYVCFDMKPQLSLSIYFLDFLFLCDIILHLITAYIDENHNLQKDYLTIFLAYLKRWLVLDLLSILPFNLLIDHSIYGFLKFLRILKYFIYRSDISYKDQSLQEIQRESLTPDSTLVFHKGHQFIVNVVITAALLTHIFGSIYHYFTECQYVYSIYWAVQTITATGYGDTLQVRELSIVWMIVGFGFYTFTIGNFSQLLSKSRLHQDSDHKFSLDQLAFVTDLNERLKFKILGFVQTNISTNAFWQEENQKMLIELPQNLQKYIMIASMLPILRQLPLFLQDINSLLKLLQRSRFFIVDVEEIIYRSGQQSNEIFFLVSGDVRIVTSNRYPLLNILEGTFFGEFEAFEESLRITYAVSKRKSLLLCLDFKCLKQVMNHNELLKFEVQQLVFRRKTLIIHQMKLEKQQRKKYRRSIVVAFSQKQLQMTYQEYHQDRKQKQLQDINLFNKYVLHKILGKKRQRYEQFIIIFKRCVSRIFDLNRQLNFTPPEEWQELDDYRLIRKIFPGRLLEEKNSNLSRRSSSVYSSRSKMFYNRMLLMSNIHFAKLSEVRIKRILFHNSKKVRERFVPLHTVINHFKSDPEFLNVHSKLTLIKSKYMEAKPRNWTMIQRFGILEEEKDQQGNLSVINYLILMNEFDYLPSNATSPQIESREFSHVQIKRRAHNGSSSRSVIHKKEIHKNATIYVFTNRAEGIRKNYFELFKKETRKLIIILTFLKSLRLYSKERLTLKAEFIKNKRQFTFPLYPDDLILIYWKYLIWIAMLVGTIFYPLYPPDDDFDEIVYAVDIIFLFDIVITFNLGYVDDNFNLNISYIKIVRTYLKGWFILDIITIMPYKIMIEYRIFGFIKLLKIIKYLFYHPYKHYNGQQSKVIVQTIQPDDSFHLSEGIIFLLTVLLKALLLIHISGCFYHYIQENDYISSFYWATQTITMVGYGDEKQNNTLSSIWIIVGLAFISINIGDFAKLLSRSNLDNDQELHQIDQLAYDSNLPEILQMEVSSFVQTNLHMNQFWSIDHKQMINQLPQQLQKYLIISSMLGTCRIVPMFLHDMNSTAELLKYSRFFVADKDKILYREGQTSKEVFYLIRGDVRIVTKNKFPLLNIMEGSLFGELEAIAESPRICYALTYSKSLLLILPFKQLKQAMHKSKALNFEVHQLYARRQQLLQQNLKNEKVQQRKLKRQNVRIFTASQINLSPSDIKTQRQEKQLQNMYSYNNQLLKRIIGFKKHKLEQFLIKFKRSVNKVIDLNRQLEITPPEDWHELNDFQLIKQVFPTKLLKIRNVNFSKIGSSLYSQSEHKIHQMMINYRNYRQVEIKLKRILLLHQRKCKERMDNITLKGVVTRFQLDPQFLNDQKITVLRGRIFAKQHQREEIITTDLDHQDIQKIIHQIDKINKFWIAGSMKQFELYQSLHQYQF